MMRFNDKNWYWFVGGDDTQVFSSASSTYVSVDDVTYQSWVRAGGVATKTTANDMLKTRITILEDSVTARRLREAAIGTDGGWLTGINSQIAALRAQITG